jgi:carotenoid cleavage dioxygenase-like enzyme
MLSGVYFKKSEGRAIQPEYFNQYVFTDVFLAAFAYPKLRTPILPSVATLINPRATLFRITYRVLRTLFLILRSFLGDSPKAVKKISVANTSIIYHDGRALATCESGPPMRVSLPDLQTVGWYDGWRAEGEPQNLLPPLPGLRGPGLTGFLKEWTTGHVRQCSMFLLQSHDSLLQPRRDPHTQEMILFHSTFLAPFIRYSVIPAIDIKDVGSGKVIPFLNIPILGIESPKMMHDFGVSRMHTIIIDLPLSLDPMNLLFNKPVIDYDCEGHTRFGVFPRKKPSQVRWFETEPCCIFHTVNTWDEIDKSTGTIIAVKMLVCRMNSPAMIFSAGNIEPPTSTHAGKEECLLHYYQFNLSPSSNTIEHQWALSAIPFELSHVPKQFAMSATQFVYGCSLMEGTFTAALGRATKVDCLAKLDVSVLIEKGLRSPPAPVTGCVDGRSVNDILASEDLNDPIKIFPMPAGWYAQECCFVPRHEGKSEDDGWLLTFVFDEAQLDKDGNAPANACSELWIIDAKEMHDVAARILLPQRVPYGLHGSWFSEDEICNQRPVESYRKF